jgi:hypothetical protein
MKLTGKKPGMIGKFGSLDKVLIGETPEMMRPFPSTSFKRAIELIPVAMTPEIKDAW